MLTGHKLALPIEALSTLPLGMPKGWQGRVSGSFDGNPRHGRLAGGIARLARPRWARRAATAQCPARQLSRRLSASAAASLADDRRRIGSHGDSRHRSRTRRRPVLGRRATDAQSRSHASCSKALLAPRGPVPPAHGAFAAVARPRGCLRPAPVQRGRWLRALSADATLHRRPFAPRRQQREIQPDADRLVAERPHQRGIAFELRARIARARWSRNSRARRLRASWSCSRRSSARRPSSTNVRSITTLTISRPSRPVSAELRSRVAMLRPEQPAAPRIGSVRCTASSTRTAAVCRRSCGTPSSASSAYEACLQRDAIAQRAGTRDAAPVRASRCNSRCTTVPTCRAVSVAQSNSTALA